MTSECNARSWMGSWNRKCYYKDFYRDNWKNLCMNHMLDISIVPKLNFLNCPVP